ncbi:N-acetylglucosamine-6-phosphate deacetylase, partial [Pseudokineococcus marinus]|nr:N-acetylglucosamine-6-phosphate deacetylase [Pseudokineococcus marinus]
RIGALAPGRAADLVLLDEDLAVRAVRPSARRAVPRPTARGAA